MNRFVRTAVALTIATAASIAAPAPARAAYPDRPVRLIVPFAPGGGTDIVGRLIADQMLTLLKQPFVVENRPGAGAMIGAEMVAKSPPDGYTLLMGTSAELTMGPHMSPARYDPVKDFVPIALVGTSPNVILANPAFEPNNIPELITYANAHPDKVSYASGGTGTGPHLSGELLKKMAHISMVHVPYKGSGPALNDVMAGQTQLMVSTVAPAIPLLSSGRVKAIAVTSANRSKMLPSVPTVAEQGLPGYEAVTWYAILAPASTPPIVADRIRAALGQILRDPAVVARLEGLGIEPGDGSADSKALQKKISVDLERWGKLIREENIRAE